MLRRLLHDTQERESRSKLVLPEIKRRKTRTTTETQTFELETVLQGRLRGSLFMEEKGRLHSEESRSMEKIRED